MLPQKRAEICKIRSHPFIHDFLSPWWRTLGYCQCPKFSVKGKGPYCFIVCYSWIEKSDHNTPLFKNFQCLSILLKIKTKVLLSVVHKAFYDRPPLHSMACSHMYASFSFSPLYVLLLLPGKRSVPDLPNCWHSSP